MPNFAGHRFAVGQTVRMTNRIGLSPKTAETFRITAILPERDNSPQYRIRNDDERHERVTTQDCLEEIGRQTRPNGAFPGAKEH